MSNSKISALTSATTPLAGTETLPVVQSSTTKQVSVANLTAGRKVGMLQANISATAGGGFPNPAFIADDGTGSIRLLFLGATYVGVPANKPWFHSYQDMYIGSDAGVSVTFVNGGNNVSITGGNIVPLAAAKGINFTANTPLAGKTSTLLNWYEEGTWTPNQGAGLTVVGAFSSTGRYTRIGRQVSISGTVTGATSVAVTAAGVITSNLPFTVVTAGHGDATNVANNASATVICTSTNVTSAAAIAATATITFSATYFV